MKKYFIPLFFVFLGCGNHSFDDVFDSTFDDVLGNTLGTGLWPGENLGIIPQDVVSFSDVDAASLPSKVLLEDKFPPVQSQGSYGTCVAWSTGYAFKTALNAIEKNWSSSDLAKPSNQTSPKDLWLVIPPDRRDKNCNGTSFSYAMDALIVNGAANMADVPYNMASSCSESNSKAKRDPNNKLANYRKIAFNEKISGSGSKIEGMDVNNFKTYLAQGRPILFGAALGDRFMKWKDNSVISSDYNTGSGHAMVLVGYDDSQGTNGAFRVRNSWGTNWGDNGSIWVDYNFFLTNFCKYAFVAQNPNSAQDPANPASNTTDLLASYAYDKPDDQDKTGNPRKRVFSYQVYNSGSTKILASQKWSVYYMYYNAYNAKDYGIIFEDYYTDEFGKLGEYGRYTKTSALVGGYWNYMDVKPGQMAGEEALGEFWIPYEMPSSVTGDYYLVVYADSKDVIKESNEDNNLYFISKEMGKPLTFKSGVMQSIPANSVESAVLAKRSKPAPVHSVVDLGELNAYTPQEIKMLLDIDKKNGVFAKKVAQYRENESTYPVKRIKRK